MCFVLYVCHTCARAHESQKRTSNLELLVAVNYPVWLLETQALCKRSSVLNHWVISLPLPASVWKHTVIKCPNKNQSRKERIYLACNSRLQSVTPGETRQSRWKQKHGPLLACSQSPFSLFIHPRPPHRGTIATHNGLGLPNPHQLTIKMIPTDMPTGQPLFPDKSKLHQAAT